jgi:ppGpp synthetase/RelA/SpoT-type nucleotidyltranferase
MFFGIAKIIFTNISSSRDELKSAKSLCEKLKKRLPVCAKSCANSNTDIPSIAISTLSKTEQDVEDILDKVLDICEASDLGRIESEYTLIEHVDILEEEDEDED